MAKKEYRNAARSKAKIRSAFSALLEQGKDPEKITVSELVKEAGVNRGTFYNHYPSIEEVSEDVENALREELSALFSRIGDGTHSKESILRSLTLYFAKKEGQFSSLCRYSPHRGFWLIRRDLANALSKRREQIGLPPMDPLRASFLVDGIVGLYVEYFSGLLPHASLSSLEKAALLTWEEFERAPAPAVV